MEPIPSELRYTNDISGQSAQVTNIDILTWWKSSGLSLNCTNDGIDTLATRDIILSWWKSSELLFENDITDE